MKSMFEKQQELSMLGEHFRNKKEELSAMVANASIPIEQILTKKKEVEEAKTRFDLMKSEIDEELAKEKINSQTKAPILDDKMAKAKAKGDFYKAVLSGQPVKPIIQSAYQFLGGIPASDPDLGHGDKLLPTNMGTELITEPFEDNPMRSIIRVTNITGLEEPKLLFDLEGSFDDITDKLTAKEIKTEGDIITYGRHKVKAKAKISDTILHGTSLNIANTVDNALRSGLAVNELRRMFATSPATEYAGMSFYSTQNGLKAVSADTKQAAIGAALADLPMAFRRNAKIVISSLDWYSMWKENINYNDTFHGDRPLQLFGKQIVLVDDAIDPVVGDFNYIGLNYDIGTTYDTDKDIDAGMYYFVLTAWYDIKFRLKSAFRIAKSSAPSPTSSASITPTSK